MSLETKDPTLAVVIERLTRLSDDVADLKSEMSEIRKDSASVNSLVTKAKGGWMVIIGIGALCSFGVTMWDKLFKGWAA